MSKLDHNNTIPRYSFIAIVMTVIALAVIIKAIYIMTAKRDYWIAVAETEKHKPDTLLPARGNIFSCDGQLMASTLPVYKMYMDFKVGGAKKDSLWNEKLDSICEGLHEIFPEKSAEKFREDLEKGHQKMSQSWPIYNKRVSYNDFVKVKKLPVFNLPKLRGGFHYREIAARRRPFGTLAGRTVGAMYGDRDEARFGLELYYDSILRGTHGMKHISKVMNEYLSVVDEEPIDGCDIVTTLDVKIQDIAERAVVDELKAINANVGVAIVMEVETGDIKAIVNMEKSEDGVYRERMNHAVADLLEPGSVFKTVSMMVALDDGVADTNYMVNTGGGTHMMHGQEMRDHNWRNGGYGTLNMSKAIQVSSNIGVSCIIDKFYESNPEKFVQGIYRTGIADDLNIPLVGAAPPRIRMPKKNSRGQYTNWSKTSLPWMSIGYETQVPPISTVTFYNAIANNGRMMRPRFIKQVLKDGEVVRDCPPEVMREQICKPSTLKKVQAMLEKVVSKGTGKAAGSTSFKVAGKTGTAQISKGASGYKSGVMQYLVSFAGYFPADAPRYTCIVCIQKSGLPASGGGMSGLCFHYIAEGIMAHDLKLDIRDAHDEYSSPTPDVKGGNLRAADYVLHRLGFSVIDGWNGSYPKEEPVWGRVSRNHKELRMHRDSLGSAGTIPNVKGLGARDAVFLIESSGARVRLKGRGKVTGQSLAAGHHVERGDTCVLTLQ